MRARGVSTAFEGTREDRDGVPVDQGDEGFGWVWRVWVLGVDGGDGSVVQAEE